jgi:hypothetical protein
VLSFPGAAASGISIQPVITWNAVVDALTYEFQLADNPSFTTPLIDSVGITATSFNVYPFVLTNATTYYWRVRAINAVSQSPYSTRYFTTVAEIYPYLAHPINGDMVYSLTPDLFWYINVAPGDIQYDVMYSVDLTFPNLLTVIADAGPNINYTVAAPLLPGTKYYWKVRSKYLPDVIVRYSVTDSFVVYGAALPPTGDYPTDSTTVYTYTPTLNWSMDLPYPMYTYEYRYKLSTAPGWGASVSVGSSLNVTLPVLVPGLTYEWQVRSHNGYVFSDWSPVYEFVIDPELASIAETPVPVYPAGGITVYTTAPAFNWSLTGPWLGLTFELEVRTDDSFTGVPTDVGLTGLWYQKTGLLSGTNYFWKIRSKLNGVYSGWSNYETFTTAAFGAISDPVLLYPIQNTPVYISTPILLWYSNAHTFTTSYDVQYKANDSDFTSGATLVTGLPLGVYTTPNLLVGTTYYWRARSHNGLLTSNWTFADSFYIVNPQGSLVPQLIYPVGGETMTDTTVQILWYVNHGHLLTYTYDIEFSLNGSFTGTPTVSGIDFNVYNFVGNAGTLYYYRIRTNNGSFQSAWSETGTFVTPSLLRPARPAVGSPVGNVTLFTPAPMLSWTVPARFAAQYKYDVEYSLTPDFNSAVQISNVAQRSVGLAGLQAGKTYYWRVRSKDNLNAVSFYSGSGVFRVESPTDVKTITALPNEYALEQNYPNPFNPATTIKFSVPEKANVTLTVYNQLGQKIAQLVNAEHEAGYYSVSWNASNMPSGIYFYELRTDKFSSIKKLILMK